MRLIFASLLALTAFSWQPTLVQPIQADGELEVSVRDVTADTSALVQFLAKVVDEEGRPIRISSSNFNVKVGAQQIPLTSVQSVTDAQVGISALLMIDTSGSMVGTPLANARQAAAQYVKSLQSTDEVSVVSFANSTRLIADFSKDFGSVESSLTGLTAFGDTGLYAAVSDAAQRMAERPAARRVVILVSDGGIGVEIGGVSRAQAIAAAASSKVPFYLIGVGPTVDTRFMKELADASGGALFIAPSSTQLAGLFGEIAELLRSEYVVTADFAGSGLSGNTSAIVRVDLGSKNGEVQLTLPLPATPVEAQTRSPRVPQPIQLDKGTGGSAAPVLILMLMLLCAVGVGAWVFWRRRGGQGQAEAYVFSGTPIYTPRESAVDPVSIVAPSASLHLESGESYQLDGTATIGVDGESTYKLPLTRSEFGNAPLRIWFANQRYAIRDEAPRTRMRVNGRAVSWSFLSDDDEIEVRGVKLRFSSSSSASITGDANPAPTSPTGA